MTYIVCGILSAFTLVAYKKYDKQLGIVFLFVLFVIGGFCTSSPDYQVYYDFFKYHSLNLGSISEPLYLLINTMAFNTGMSYQSFFAIQVALSLLLIYSISRYFDSNIAIVLMFFCAFPFAINVVQIRNFLSFSIVLFAFIFLFEYYNSGEKKHLLIFVVTVIFSSLIHFSAAFFLICIIPVLFRNMRTWKTVLIGIVSGFLLSNLDVLYSLLVPIIGMRKAETWLSGNETYSFLHIIIVIFLRLLLIGIIFLLDHAIQSDQVCVEEISSRSNSIDSFLYNESLFLILSILPLELLLQQYDRFSRVYLVLFYIFFSRRIPKLELKNRIILWVLTILMMSLLCYYEYSRGTNSGYALWDTVFRSVFEHNALIS